MHALPLSLCHPDDHTLAAYMYTLPLELIAQEPLERGAARLCVLGKGTVPLSPCALSDVSDRARSETAVEAGRVSIRDAVPCQAYSVGTHDSSRADVPVLSSPLHTIFDDLPSLLPEGALLVVNKSRVLPTRLLGTRPSGGRMEMLMLSPVPLLRPQAVTEPCAAPMISVSPFMPSVSSVFFDRQTIAGQGQGWLCAEVDALLRPAKVMKVGTVLTFANSLHVEVLEKGTFGMHRVRLFWQGSLQTFFEAHGRLPLPPYIRRPDTAADLTRYQTVYASAASAGSVAAPTAGLHFTQTMRERLAAAGFGWAELTLHVGYGTFSPVRCQNIHEHRMHAEYVELDASTCASLVQAKAQGRPIIAVGTTAARTLEGIAQAHGGDLVPYKGLTNVFITPGHVFKVIDGLITNFHLPESTLLMLVSALTGRERLLASYAEAVARAYRFFSYGDAMLIR